MLRPEFFDFCADDILALYAKLEESIIADMCRRIARMGRISDATAWQAARLQETGTLYDNIISEIAKTTNNREEVVKEAFEKAGVEALSIDDSIYKAAGLDPLPLKQSQAMLSVLQAGLIKTNSVMQNLTMTTAVSTQQAYMQACDLAYMQVSTGAMDYRTAITRAVVSACEQGATVLYPTGHVDKLDVAIRRSVLTGVNQTCGKLQEARADEMECDLVETTAHAGARPSHAVWQGKVFSRSGSSNKYPPFSLTDYGTGAGLCGWNCRHSFFPYFEGLSESAYPREVLDEYNNRTVVIDGKEMSYYDATQLQRKMERSIRESRRTLKGIDEALKEDPENFKLKGEFAIQSVKLKEKEAAMNNFIYKANLQKDSSRVWSGGFGKSVSQKAVWANKKFVKSKKDDIIKLTDKDQRALNQYISSESYTINRKLRNKEPLTESQKELIKHLDSALSKMPYYKGKVYRSLSDFDLGMSVDEFIKAHKPGKIISFCAYTSSSTKVYDASFPIQYIIDSKTGRDIQQYNPTEFEVLFERNKRFIVDKVEKNIIYVKEI